jgi:hypothetical protein
MGDSRFLLGAIMLAAVAWLFAAMGWWRVATARSDEGKLAALHDAALVMSFASIVTATAAAASVW